MGGLERCDIRCGVSARKREVATTSGLMCKTGEPVLGRALLVSRRCVSRRRILVYAKALFQRGHLSEQLWPVELKENPELSSKTLVLSKHGFDLLLHFIIGNEAAKPNSFSINHLMAVAVAHQSLDVVESPELFFGELDLRLWGPRIIYGSRRGHGSCRLVYRLLYFISLDM